MEIVKIISEYKKVKKREALRNGKILIRQASQFLARGHKRVEAIVRIDGVLVTRHIDIKK